MILSGQADLESTILAVNEGNVFRFLTKPCPGDLLLRGVSAALEQYRLVRAEKDLLERTLSGSVQVLVEVLELARPEAFSRSARIREYVEALGARLGVECPWQLRLAAMLSQVGCVALPGEALARIRRIPRLEGVARIVSDQDGSGEHAPTASAVELRASAMLRAVVHLVDALERGRPRDAALGELAGRAPQDIVAALRQIDVHGESTVRSLEVEHLRIGMVLDEDVVARSGLLLARKNQTVTDTMLVRLRNFAKGQGVVEPIRALVPARKPVAVPSTQAAA
jgi:hypothetical protein